MNEAMIGLITALLAALIGVGTAVWTNARTVRQQEQSQRAQWEHDRRRDAYLAFSKAGRAFAPLTEEVFLLAARAEAASATSPVDELTGVDGEQVVLQFTWHEDLQPPVITEPAGEWNAEAPSLLQALTAAYDGVNLEGPPEIAQTAYSIVATAHRLTAGMPLFEIEAKRCEETDEDGRSAGPSAWDLLNAEVGLYFKRLHDFQREAKTLLEKAGSSRPDS
ncbi:hypothetical protein ABZW50_19190 [Streptomyces bacillaris]